MDSFPNPVLLLGGLLLLGLVPFLAIMLSSFVKIVVVLHLLRNALGLQQVPPNMAINGLAIILSIYIMAPVGINIYETFDSYGVAVDDVENPAWREALRTSVEPLREFLQKHSDENEREFFASTTRKLWPPELAENVDKDHFLVLLPAFTVSQLTTAFQIGFLLYLPFVVIDLVVSNILLAMGMIMVAPMMISLPFKILLFVLADGWTRLVHGLVLSYQ